MSSKTRLRVENQFHAKSFDNFAELEENKNRIEMAKLFRNNQDKPHFKDRKGQKQQAKERHIVFEFVSPTHYAVTFQNFFDPSIKDLIKSVSQARYDAETKAWVIPQKQKDELINKIGSRCLSEGITLVDVPKFVSSMLEAKVPFAKSRKQSIDYGSEVPKSVDTLPESLIKCLYPFQNEGVKYGTQKFGRCLFGDEMGVGKTIQAIATAYLYKNDWPLLVITPSSLKFQWRDEILKWIPTLQ